MKRFISILLFFSLFTFAIFADEQGDEYDDGYVYEQNGEGDQFLKIDLAANFPLNFYGQLYTGAGANIGYYRFLNSKLALGGEVTIGYNITIGSKSMITVPIVFGAMFQPTAGKFEFPLTAGIGIGGTSCQGMTYFPSFAAKISAGAYFRATESWSFGILGSSFWIPQWFADSEKNDNGFFATAGIGARYHF